MTRLPIPHRRRPSVTPARRSLRARATAASCAGLLSLLAACGGAGSDEVELEPLVPPDPDEVELEPLVPDEQEPLEPLFEPGTDPAEAYHLEMTYTATVGLALGIEISDAPIEIGVADEAIRDSFAGDLVRTGPDVYGGRLHATSQGISTVSVFGLEPCTSSWDGEQTVEAVAEVVDGDDPDDVGALYLSIVLKPVGAPRWDDAEDCDGPLYVDSLHFADHNLVTGLPITTTPRLPPPGYGKIEERDPFELGDNRTEWVTAITPIERSDADPDIAVIEGELEPLVGDLLGDYEIALDGAFDAGLHDGDLDSEDSACLYDDAFSNGVQIEHDSGEAPRIFVSVTDVAAARTGTDDFSFLAAFDDDERYYELNPASGDGSGEALVTMGDDSTVVTISGATADGVRVEAEFRCDTLERTGA